MPGPTTEVLNDDLKELKREVHEGHEQLRRDFVKVAIELAELRGELKATLGIAKWAGALLVTTILTSGAGGLWWASGLNAKVAGLGERMDERFKSSDNRLDRIEAAIGRLLDQGRPAQPTTKADVDAVKK